MTMTDEQRKTIRYYRKFPDRFCKLTDDEVSYLKSTLDGYFLLILQTDTSINKKRVPIRDVHWKQYNKQVRETTARQPVHLLPDSDKPKPSSFQHLHSSEHYVIDHKISVWYGFKNNIPIDVIAGLDNLRWIPSKDNCNKGIKCIFE